jgi:hypothetical protein
VKNDGLKSGYWAADQLGGTWREPIALLPGSVDSGVPVEALSMVLLPPCSKGPTVQSGGLCDERVTGDRRTSGGHVAHPGAARFHRVAQWFELLLQWFLY